MKGCIVPEFEIVIVGAGHAGAQAAVALRQQGCAASIAIIGDEPELPYERPPLSKEYLAGTIGFERIMIRPPQFWAERDVTMLLGCAVVAVNPVERTVTLADGRKVRYGSLIWAAGGTPRRLTCGGHDLARVHCIRNRADVDRLAGELPVVDRVVVIGGGYIGMEAAAVLIELGKHVVLIEAQPRILARVSGPEISRFYEAEHRAHGVDLRTGTGVDCILGTDAATGVRLDDGRIVAADMVIVGIGIDPNIAPLAAAGAVVGNGIEVDELCRTSLPGVFAVGDCASHANGFADGVRIRLESVQNANDQATVAAKAIVGNPEPYHAVPWFWSTQYDLRLQTVGLSTGHDTMILRGDTATRSFSVVYTRRGRVIALDCVNSVQDYVQGRALVARGAAPRPEQLADIAVPLKALAA